MCACVFPGYCSIYRIKDVFYLLCTACTHHMINFEILKIKISSAHDAIKYTSHHVVVVTR